MFFGGAGHAQGMLTSLKNNKRERKSKFDKDFDSYKKQYGKLKDYKKMSPEQFKVFQKKLQQQEKARQQKLLLTFAAIMIIVLVIIGYLLFIQTTSPIHPIK